MNVVTVLSKEDMIVAISNFFKELDGKTENQKVSLIVEYYKFLMRDDVIEKLLNTEKDFKQVTINKAKELFQDKNHPELYNTIKYFLFKVVDKNKSQ
jgi:hypothetical protein